MNKTNINNNKMNKKKQIIDNNEINENKNIGNDLFFNSKWNVWIHKSSNSDWDISSYEKIYTITNISTFWRFFSNYQMIDKIDNQIFIMRDDIKPIWEDNANKNGGTCSIKFNYITNKYNNENTDDFGSGVMIALCMLIMNETLIQEKNEINGISYSVKSNGVIIKIWNKNNKYEIATKLPVKLFNDINYILKSKALINKKNNTVIDNKVSIKYIVNKLSEY